jgi:hypothetical protein
MLPLENIFLIPSSIVAPLVLMVFFVLRRRMKNYPLLWAGAMLLSVLFSSLFLLQVLSTRLYSERIASPSNPGGTSASISTGVAVFLVETCILIPAYPILIGLSLLAPSHWKIGIRIVLLAACILFIASLCSKLIEKNSAFNTNYQQTRKQQFQKVDQFEHLRRP